MIVQGPAVTEWVREKTGPGLGGSGEAIGWLKDGLLTAGVAFDYYTGPNIMAHFRIDAPPPKGYWAAVAEYIFEDLGCERTTGFTEECDQEALRLSEHIGFVEEARLKGAARDGGDIIISVLWKDACKMLGWRKS